MLYRYNEEKVTNWLKLKVHMTSITIAKQRQKLEASSNMLYTEKFNASAQSNLSVGDLNSEVIRPIEGKYLNY